NLQFNRVWNGPAPFPPEGNRKGMKPISRAGPQVFGGRLTSILPSMDVKTALSWRGIVPFTHLAREGRMTVAIGRQELLSSEQQSAMPVMGFLYLFGLTQTS